MKKYSKYLVVALSLIGITICRSQNLSPLHLAPIPQFSALNLCAGDTANFINQTQGGVNYAWVLSAVDTIQNTKQQLDSANTVDYSYYFNTPGLYEIALYADNGHLTTLSRTITVGPITKAFFEFQRCSNQMVNLSTCANKFFWQFGDGDTSSNPVPVHIYSDTGYYTVKLKAWKGTVMDSISQNIYVDATGSNASFTMAITNNTVTVGLMYPVIPAFSINWNFGDGNTVSGTTVATNVYPDSTASYYITLMLVSPCGIAGDDTTLFLISSVGLNEVSFSDNLTIFPSPSSDFITIKGESVSSVTLMNLLGSTLITKQFVNGTSYTRLDLADLPAGQYILSIQSGQTSIYRKIIKI